MSELSGDDKPEARSCVQHGGRFSLFVRNDYGSGSIIWEAELENVERNGKTPRTNVFTPAFGVGCPEMAGAPFDCSSWLIGRPTTVTWE